MNRDDRIPPSPSAEEYARQLEANGDESEFERDEPFVLFGDWLASRPGRQAIAAVPAYRPVPG